MKTKLLLALFPLLIIGCVQKPAEEVNNTYTISMISEHNNSSDCWMIIGDNVYDVTDYISSHPGGEESITNGCGINATTLFETRPSGSGTPHSRNARNILEDYKIGRVE